MLWRFQGDYNLTIVNGNYSPTSTALDCATRKRKRERMSSALDIVNDQSYSTHEYLIARSRMRVVCENGTSVLVIGPSDVRDHPALLGSTL